MSGEKFCKLGPHSLWPELISFPLALLSLSPFDTRGLGIGTQQHQQFEETIFKALMLMRVKARSLAFLQQELGLYLMQWRP